MNTRITQVDMIVVGFTDAYGELRTQAINETSDNVDFEGYTEDDSLVCFCSEAYHLPLWCEELGFTVYRGSLSMEVILESE